MSSYMLLVVEQPQDRVGRPPGEGDQRMEQMVRWGKALTERGVLEASNSLRSHKDAVRVQVQNGRRSLVDGPFAEAKEMIGGYFLLNCASLDEAVALAGECPAAQWATIEVREIGPCSE